MSYTNVLIHIALIALVSACRTHQENYGTTHGIAKPISAATQTTPYVSDLALSYAAQIRFALALDKGSGPTGELLTKLQTQTAKLSDAELGSALQVPWNEYADNDSHDSNKPVSDANEPNETVTSVGKNDQSIHVLRSIGIGLVATATASAFAVYQWDRSAQKQSGYVTKITRPMALEGKDARPMLELMINNQAVAIQYYDLLLKASKISKENSDWIADKKDKSSGPSQKTYIQYILTDDGWHSVTRIGETGVPTIVRMNDGSLPENGELIEDINTYQKSARDKAKKSRVTETQIKAAQSNLRFWELQSKIYGVVKVVFGAGLVAAVAAQAKESLSLGESEDSPALQRLRQINTAVIATSFTK